MWPAPVYFIGILLVGACRGYRIVNGTEVVQGETDKSRYLLLLLPFFPVLELTSCRSALSTSYPELFGIPSMRALHPGRKGWMLPTLMVACMIQILRLPAEGR